MASALMRAAWKRKLLVQVSKVRNDMRTVCFKTCAGDLRRVPVDQPGHGYLAKKVVGRYNRRVRGVDRKVPAFVVQVGRGGTLRVLRSPHCSTQHNLPEQDDLQVPEPPPKLRPRKQIPLVARRLFLAQLKVGWQRLGPRLEALVQPDCLFWRDTRGCQEPV